MYTTTEKSPWWLAKAMCLQYGAQLQRCNLCRFPANHSIQRTVVTFELEYINIVMPDLLVGAGRIEYKNVV
jgi:hypothetical protein